MTRKPPPESPPLPSEQRALAHAGNTNVWLVSRQPIKRTGGTVWLKRPMPDGQWPVDQSLPRDDSFSWWVRSACGHTGGGRQWAFTEERYADMYALVFYADPCRWSPGCQDRKRREENR